MKPLKACKAPADLSTIRYPVLISPKLDGIRCLVRDGVAYSQRGLPIPNRHVQAVLHRLPDGLDGELVLQDWTEPHRMVASAVMSRHGEPDFCYAVFDWFHKTRPYEDRLYSLEKLVEIDLGEARPHVIMVPQVVASTQYELQAIHDEHVAVGYEGSMIRDPNGRYKQGRSTEREGILMKMKSFDDEEATVLGTYVAEENLNAELASGRRGSSRAGKRAKDHLGGFLCRFDDGTEFGCGSGFTLAERELYWQQDPAMLVGKRATIKHQPPPGGRKPGEAPRFPVWKGLRHD